MTEPRRKKTRNKGEGARKKSSNRKRKGIIARTTQVAENAHRTIAGLPLDLLERFERLKRPIARVRKLQGRSITATYDMLGGVNREVADLLNETRGQKEPKRRKTRTIRHPKRVVETSHPPRAAAAAS